jgi:hypothetical protein
MNALFYTDPEGVKHPVELVAKHPTPRFYIVRSKLTNQIKHVNAPEIILNGRFATTLQLDELLTTHTK